MPGVIGIMLIAITKRFVGARVSTLLGTRLSFSSPDRKVVILSASLPASRSVTGDLTRPDPTGQASCSRARCREAARKEDDPPDLRTVPDGFHCKGIFEGKHAVAALRTRDCGDA